MNVHLCQASLTARFPKEQALTDAYSPLQLPQLATSGTWKGPDRKQTPLKTYGLTAL